MKEIKRYDLVVHRITGSPGTSNNDNGKVCFYDDHAAVVAALNEKVQALAAEVSECRRFVAEELGQESGVQFSGLNTERRDEVIRNIRAQGVEGYANELRINGIAAKENGHDITADFLSKESSRATVYAARIRKGEQE